MTWLEALFTSCAQAVFKIPMTAQYSSATINDLFLLWLTSTWLRSKCYKYPDAFQTLRCTD